MVASKEPPLMVVGIGKPIGVLPRLLQPATSRGGFFMGDGFQRRQEGKTLGFVGSQVSFSFPSLSAFILGWVDFP